MLFLRRLFYLISANYILYLCLSFENRQRKELETYYDFTNNKKEVTENISFKKIKECLR